MGVGVGARDGDEDVRGAEADADADNAAAGPDLDPQKRIPRTGLVLPLPPVLLPSARSPVYDYDDHSPHRPRNGDSVRRVRMETGVEIEVGDGDGDGIEAEADDGAVLGLRSCEFAFVLGNEADAEGEGEGGAMWDLRNCEVADAAGDGVRSRIVVVGIGGA